MVDKTQKNVNRRNNEIQLRNSLEEKIKYEEKFKELNNKIKKISKNLNKNFKIMIPKFLNLNGKEMFMGVRLNFNIFQTEKKNNEKINKMKEEDKLKENIFENKYNVKEEKNNILKVGGENTKIIIFQPNEEPSLLKQKRGPFTITNSSPRKVKKIKKTKNLIFKKQIINLNIMSLYIF